MFVFFYSQILLFVQPFLGTFGTLHNYTLINLYSYKIEILYIRSYMVCVEVVNHARLCREDAINQL